MYSVNFIQIYVNLFLLPVLSSLIVIMYVLFTRLRYCFIYAIFNAIWSLHLWKEGVLLNHVYRTKDLSDPRPYNLCSAIDWVQFHA